VDVTHELEGWELFFAELRPTGQADEELAALRREVADGARARLRLDALSEHPAVAGLRKLFRRAGVDPTRYRSGSEALLRRLLRGEEMPLVNPLVDLGNCVAAELASNVCVMDADKAAPPFVLRAGRPGEEMLSLRGPLDLAGKPVLFDTLGPADVPITGADRVRVTDATRRAYLVVYLPAGIVSKDDARRTLEKLLSRAPVARASEI
jgi:DNA/RNA-binding domain of Phe-tRNA-synthetase-like protein